MKLKKILKGGIIEGPRPIQGESIRPVFVTPPIGKKVRFNNDISYLKLKDGISIIK